MGVARVDGVPGNIHTQSWLPGKIYPYRQRLAIPCDLNSGQYDLLLAGYLAENSDILPITAEDGTPLGDYAYLTTLTIK